MQTQHISHPPTIPPFPSFDSFWIGQQLLFERETELVPAELRKVIESALRLRDLLIAPFSQKKSDAANSAFLRDAPRNPLIRRVYQDASGNQLLILVDPEISTPELLALSESEEEEFLPLSLDPRFEMEFSTGFMDDSLPGMSLQYKKKLTPEEEQAEAERGRLAKEWRVERAEEQLETSDV